MKRYEKIWEFQSEIEKFIDLKFNIPNYRPRSKLSLEADLKRKVCIESYKLLDQKVRNLPDFQILS